MTHESKESQRDNLPSISSTDIQKLTRRLWTIYLLVWALPIISVVLHATGVFEEGTFAHDGRLCYILQTCAVLLTLCLVPASLKWFSPDIRSGLPSYRRRSETRLALLAIVIVIGLSVYHTTLSSLGGLCAAVGLVATLFCIPGLRRDYENLQANS